MEFVSRRRAALMPCINTGRGAMFPRDSIGARRPRCPPIVRHSVPPPAERSVTIAGPAGEPGSAAGNSAERATARAWPSSVIRIRVYGGTMTNKVVHMLAKSFNERGVPARAFQFPRRGRERRRYDEGEGETQDALAAIDWALQRWPGAALWARGLLLRRRDRRARGRGARCETPGHGRAGGPPVRCRRRAAAALSVAARAGRSAMNWSTPARSNAGWRRSPRRRSSRCCRASIISFTAGSTSCATVVLEWLDATGGVDEHDRALEADLRGPARGAGAAGAARAARARDRGVADRAGALGFFRVDGRARRDPPAVAEALRPGRGRGRNAAGGGRPPRRRRGFAARIHASAESASCRRARSWRSSRCCGVSVTPTAASTSTKSS